MDISHFSQATTPPNQGRPDSPVYANLQELKISQSSLPRRRSPEAQQFRLMENGKLIKIVQGVVITITEEHRKELGNPLVGLEIQT